MSPITYASGNFPGAVAELEPDEDADLEDSDLDSDDSPDEEESGDAAVLPDPPA